MILDTCGDTWVIYFIFQQKKSPKKEGDKDGIYLKLSWWKKMKSLLKNMWKNDMILVAAMNSWGPPNRRKCTTMRSNHLYVKKKFFPSSKSFLQWKLVNPKLVCWSKSSSWFLCKKLSWQRQANKQFIAHQLSFDKEIHKRKLKCLHCLLT